MRRIMTIGLAATVLFQIATPASRAQVADPKTPAAPPVSSSAAGLVIQAQLHAPGPATRTGGTEANDLYKHYLGWVGHPMVITEESGDSTSGQGHGGSGQ